MPKFLIEATFTAQAAQGIQREGGSSRVEVVSKMAEALGGRMEVFYFAFGDRDVVTIVDLPGNEAAAAVALAVNGSGAVKAKTTVLLTPEDVDEATKRSVAYRAPGA